MRRQQALEQQRQLEGDTDWYNRTDNDGRLTLIAQTPCPTPHCWKALHTPIHPNLINKSKHPSQRLCFLRTAYLGFHLRPELFDLICLNRVENKNLTTSPSYFIAEGRRRLTVGEEGHAGNKQVWQTQKFLRKRINADRKEKRPQSLHEKLWVLAVCDNMKIVEVPEEGRRCFIFRKDSPKRKRGKK